MNTIPDLTADSLAWEKMNGLIPVIVQHAEHGDVLMLGYMNEEAFTESIKTRQLTFYSRSKQRLWRKGETSGHVMEIQGVRTDCDRDTLLVHVLPKGPACHLGTPTCFEPAMPTQWSFLHTLTMLISERARSQSHAASYTNQLLSSGIERCAQKVGEEAVETVIVAVAQKSTQLVSETADLLFHLLVLLQASGTSFLEIIKCLKERHSSRSKNAQNERINQKSTCTISKMVGSK